MRKTFSPIAVFAALSLSGCGDDVVDALRPHAEGSYAMGHVYWRETEKPAAGIRVNLMSGASFSFPYEPVAAEFVSSSTTDASGAFRIDFLWEPGSFYELDITGQDYRGLATHDLQPGSNERLRMAISVNDPLAVVSVY